MSARTEFEKWARDDGLYDHDMSALWACWQAAYRTGLEDAAKIAHQCWVESDCLAECDVRIQDAILKEAKKQP